MAQHVGFLARWSRAVIALALMVIVGFALFWLAGTFRPKISPHDTVAAVTRSAAGLQVVPVREVTLSATEGAVGSVRAAHETSIAAKLLARVVEVNVRAGQAVEKDALLIRLDDTDLRAREQQAIAAVDAATASRQQAQVEFDRIHALFEQHNASEIEFQRVKTALEAATAELYRAEQILREARTMLGYTEIRAPMRGIVIEKLVEVGDTAIPGRPLLKMYDPERMQLVASVRESHAVRLSVGQPIGVRIDALNQECVGQISEIVPESETASRSFAVKVTGPCPPGVYSGMFARMLIPLDDERVLLIPAAAVRTVGQLRLVDVLEGESLRRRAVQLGRAFGDDVEVLSGLRIGERVALVPGAADAKEAR